MHDPIPPQLAGRLTRWREQLAAHVADLSAREELEAHLRDALSAALARGAGPDEAWRAATTSLGSPTALGGEFAKLGAPSRVDRVAVLSIALLGALGALALAGFGWLAVQSKGDGGLLAAHVVTLCLSYAGALTLATCSSLLLLRRLGRAAWAVRGMHPDDARQLALATRVGWSFVAITCAAGTFLGAAWAAGTDKPAWSWSPQETGAFLILAYYTGLIWTTGRRELAPEVRLALSTAGGALTLVAWFGTRGAESSAPPILTAIVLACLGLAATARLRPPLASTSRAD